MSNITQRAVNFKVQEPNQGIDVLWIWSCTRLWIRHRAKKYAQRFEWLYLVLTQGKTAMILSFKGRGLVFVHQCLFSIENTVKTLCGCAYPRFPHYRRILDDKALVLAIAPLKKSYWL
jgi:hypothetical protein